MEFKGTKGEWEVSKIDLFDFKQICIFQNESPKGKAICHMYFKNEITQEIEANAQLIASAPELLEFLIELYEDKETYSDMFPNQQIKLKELIEKATKID